MSKPVIVSGTQPSGFLHIGNYLGAIKNWVDLQNSGKYDCFFFIADFHSITENYSPAEKRVQVLNLACDYLAAGLDPKKSTIFIQSQVPQCTELAWIFNTLTPIGELERMIQFKDKSQKQNKNVNAGLLTYPILQAADILIYHGEFVPVGQDQIQHLELTHDTVKWFNNKYATKYFQDVKPLLTETPKIMSLVEPTSKMSKSAGAKHYIGIDESPEIISQKLSKAVSTPEGIENLRAIYKAFEKSMSGEFKENKMSETKKIIAQGIANYFADFRKKKAELMKDPKKVMKILEQGKKKAQPIAQKTLQEVKKIIGLI
ncbi:MAG: tryptophan--tRNA ligase [Patescibacteria group bacterium]|jgi:tryptophanyl-tRNA synthetase